MASKFGVSANPKKANHILGKDKVVRIAVKNDNDYIAEPNLIPQRKVYGKWETIKTNSPNRLTQQRNSTMNSISRKVHIDSRLK
ncbi:MULTISPECIES: hypothetical protein [Bacillus]|uniref:hypothetical protein n=1 Tax=Bacillus TaxID=1386 RepID=UPI001EE4CB7A|nr:MULTISPECIES: hypothetical protein [Bacillus]MCP1148619.1 hypothetical protein [Bacillus sp. 1735sda2]